MLAQCWSNFRDAQLFTSRTHEENGAPTRSQFTDSRARVSSLVSFITKGFDTIHNEVKHPLASLKFRISAC